MIPAFLYFDLISHFSAACQIRDCIDYPAGVVLTMQLSSGRMQALIRPSPRDAMPKVQTPPDGWPCFYPQVTTRAGLCNPIQQLRRNEPLSLLCNIDSLIAGVFEAAHGP